MSLTSATKAKDLVRTEPRQAEPQHNTLSLGESAVLGITSIMLPVYNSGIRFVGTDSAVGLTKTGETREQMRRRIISESAVLSPKFGQGVDDRRPKPTVKDPNPVVYKAQEFLTAVLSKEI